MIDTTPRKTAKALGLKRYEGRACLHGHGTTRFVASGDCVQCRNTAKAKSSMQKRILRGPVKLGRKRKYPIFVGPPKPRKTQKYDKTTDFGMWVWRSKNGVKASARSKLTIKDYEDIRATHCPLLGIELTYKSCGNNRTPDNYATLDRIDSTKGYVPGNVQILSFRANTLKGDATLEELKLVIKNWENMLQRSNL
jgi:hypothetical protein